MGARNLRTLALLVLALAPVRADQVIMKDGTVYKGKILIDTDKAILIGNPPFDPKSYLLQAEDIDKIIYEEYHPNPPAERKRGLTFETRLNGDIVSSNQEPVAAGASLYMGMGFRVHPLVEINGGVDWTPANRTSDLFSVSDGTTTRHYQDYWQFGPVFSLRLYPFYQKKWKSEPYIAAGYRWSTQVFNSSGDSLKGAGWHIGFGAIRPITMHIFLEGRFVYESLSYDTVHFLGREGGISPEIEHHVVSLSVGASYRL